MDVLEHAYSVLSVIVEALQICKGGRAPSRSSGSSRERRSELRFCFSLRSTLEDIVAWHPSNVNFAHDHELSVLIHAVSHHLEHFCDVLETCMPILEDACEHFDPSKQDDATRLESQLRNSIMQPVKTLRKQVHRYIPAVNTLLLLYIIAVLTSPPLEPIPEDQIAELKSIGQRAKIMFAHNLQKSLKFSSTTQNLSIPEQQSFLNSLKRDAERHWESVQLTMLGAWGMWDQLSLLHMICVLSHCQWIGDAVHLSEHDLSSATQSGPETPNITLSSGQGSCQKYQNPSRKQDNEKRSDNSSRQYHPPQQFEGTSLEQGRSRQQNQQQQSPYCQLQSQRQGWQPQQQHHQQRQQLHMYHQSPDQQEQPHQQQPVQQWQPYSQSPQQPQQRGHPALVTSYHTGSFNSGGRSDHQSVLPAQKIPNNNISRRVEQMEMDDSAAQQQKDDDEGSCCVIL
ncbi:hypothetical protein VTG60DRAFT_3142 [Thermothelomyces hinnuleus]